MDIDHLRLIVGRRICRHGHCGNAAEEGGSSWVLLGGEGCLPVTSNPAMTSLDHGVFKALKCWENPWEERNAANSREICQLLCNVIEGYWYMRLMRLVER